MMEASLLLLMEVIASNGIATTDEWQRWEACLGEDVRRMRSSVASLDIYTKAPKHQSATSSTEVIFSVPTARVHG